MRPASQYCAAGIDELLTCVSFADAFDDFDECFTAFFNHEGQTMLPSRHTTQRLKSKWLIVAISVPIVVFIIVGALLSLFLLKRRKNLPSKQAPL